MLQGFTNILSLPRQGVLIGKYSERNHQEYTYYAIQSSIAKSDNTVMLGNYFRNKIRHYQKDLCVVPTNLTEHKGVLESM